MPRLFTILLIFVFTGQHLFAQKKQGQVRIDSLIAELPKQKEDTVKVKLLNKIAAVCARVDVQMGGQYAQQALTLAEQLKWKQGQIKALKLIAMNATTSDFDKMITCYKQCVTLAESLGDENEVATNLASIGMVYVRQNNYPRGLEYYFAALKMDEKSGNKSGKGRILALIASAYHAKNNNETALQYYYKSLEVYKEIDSKSSVIAVLSQIGIIRVQQKDYDNALVTYAAALKIAEELKEKTEIATIYLMIGECYLAREDYTQAMDYRLKALELFKVLGERRSIIMAMRGVGDIYEQQKKYPEALQYYLDALRIARDIDQPVLIAEACKTIGYFFIRAYRNNTGRNNYLAQSTNYFLEAATIYEKTGVLESALALYEQLAENYKLSGDYKAALSAHEQYTKYKDSIFNKENTEKFTRLEVTAEYEKVQLADSLKNVAARNLAAAKLKRQRNYTYAGIGGVLLLVGFSFFIFKERRKSDKLLLNILPVEVAKELKSKGESDAKLFDDVTILFTDFVGFTTVSEKLTPKQLVDELHTCFTAFDGIMAKHNIEKIKTVGDAYLAVCGLPKAENRHAENVVAAALEIRDFMLSRKQELGENGFDIRIGIHSGNVVAGIVGVKKFAYDIWGDTVNVAARMEQNSVAGKINISQTTYHLVKDKYNCTYRGGIEAKNKGMLEMYFVESKKA